MLFKSRFLQYLPAWSLEADSWKWHRISRAASRQGSARMGWWYTSGRWISASVEGSLGRTSGCLEVWKEVCRKWVRKVIWTPGRKWGCLKGRKKGMSGEGRNFGNLTVWRFRRREGRTFGEMKGNNISVSTLWGHFIFVGPDVRGLFNHRTDFLARKTRSNCFGQM